jgi:hypothetical protein
MSARSLGPKDGMHHRWKAPAQPCPFLLESEPPLRFSHSSSQPPSLLYASIFSSQQPSRKHLRISKHIPHWNSRYQAICPPSPPFSHSSSPSLAPHPLISSWPTPLSPTVGLTGSPSTQLVKPSGSAALHQPTAPPSSVRIARMLQLRLSSLPASVPWMQANSFLLSFPALIPTQVEVPGGQQIYVNVNGALGFTQAHSAAVPTGAYIGGFFNLTYMSDCSTPRTVINWKSPDGSSGAYP